MAVYVVHTVEITSAVSLHFTVTVTMSRDGAESVRELNVRDDGWKLWMYREDPTMGPVLVDTVSWGASSERTPDRDTALESIAEWAHEHYEG